MEEGKYAISPESSIGSNASSGSGHSDEEEVVIRLDRQQPR